MTSPQTLLKVWNLRALKELGQNFLVNPSMAQHIVDHTCLDPNDVVLEIGSGLGMMTISAAQKVRKLIAIEKDRRLVPLLRAQLLANGLEKVHILEQDILKIPLEKLVEKGKMKPMVVLGNLPYNISSQVVVKLIEERRHVDRAVLMFQKELADRLCAKPGTKAYGRLSVRLQYCADLNIVLNVKADQFHPRPKVDSAVLGIQFKDHIDYCVNDEKLLSQVVKAAFGQRRKNLRNSLSGNILQLDKQTAEDLLKESEIDPMRRAESLSVDAFVTLTNNIGSYLNHQP